MKVKPVNPFIARILDNDVTMFEIVAHNARVSREMLDEGVARNCDPDTCRRKYCHHGNPRWAAAQRAHTEKLEAEAISLAQEMTSCHRQQGLTTRTAARKSSLLVRMCRKLETRS